MIETSLDLAVVLWHDETMKQWNDDKSTYPMWKTKAMTKFMTYRVEPLLFWLGIQIVVVHFRNRGDDDSGETVKFNFVESSPFGRTVVPATDFENPVLVFTFKVISHSSGG